MARFHLCVVLTLLWGCFVLNVDGDKQRNSPFGPKSYFDFVHDFVILSQHADEGIDQDVIRVAENVTKNVKSLFQRLSYRQHSEKKVSSFTDKVSKKNNLIFESELDIDHSTHDYNSDFMSVKVLEKLDGLRDYARENNGNLTSQCIEDIGRLIVSFLSGEGWAVQFFDATGKPGPALNKKHFEFVGDFDQCIAATAPVEKRNNSLLKGGFTGNYCVVTVFTGNPIIMPQLGACLPSSCSSKDVTMLMNELLYSTIKLPLFAECRPAPTEMTAATIVAIVILAVIGEMMLLGTVYDLFMRSRSARSKVLENSETGRSEDKGALEAEGAKENGSDTTPIVSNFLFTPGSSSPWAKVLIAFSVYSNGEKVLSTFQPPGSLGSIHGIRFLSMSWVVLCHLYGSIVTNSVNKLETVSTALHSWSYLVITNGFPSVDTFFTLSGLLTSYLTIKGMSRRRSWNVNWPMFYFHRFWRLTPPYMFSLVIVLGLTQYFSTGPLRANVQPSDKRFCEKNWWTNLLYINNLVHTHEGCFGVSWYLANDMQFFVLSPLMIVPFFFHRLAGVISCMIFLIITTVTTGVLSSQHHWPTTTVSAANGTGDFNRGDWFPHYYIKPWCRIGPYVVGILAGYVLAQTKGRQFKMTRLVVFLGWISAFASGLAVVYGLHGDITGDNVSSTGVAALYNAVSRSVWGACVCWVIVACSAGYGGPINSLLSWSPFVVLGRLTYMSYLIHITILGVFAQNLGSLLWASPTSLAIIYLGLLVAVNMAAFVATLALESPMMGLEKALLKRNTSR